MKFEGVLSTGCVLYLYLFIYIYIYLYVLHTLKRLARVYVYHYISFRYIDLHILALTDFLVHPLGSPNAEEQGEHDQSVDASKALIVASITVGRSLSV